MSRRVVMRQIRKILRCHFAQGLSREAIARAVGVAKGSVTNVLQRFQTSALSWPLDSSVSDADLEARLYRQRLHEGRITRDMMPCAKNAARWTPVGSDEDRPSCEGYAEDDINGLEEFSEWFLARADK